MNERDPLQCNFEDARRNQLRDGVALSTAAKVAFFEEMVEFAVHFGARDRLAGRRGAGADRHKSSTPISDSRALNMDSALRRP